MKGHIVGSQYVPLGSASSEGIQKIPIGHAPLEEDDSYMNWELADALPTPSSSRPPDPDPDPPDTVPDWGR